MDRNLYGTVAALLLLLLGAAARCAPVQPPAARLYIAGDIMAGRGLAGRSQEEWGNIFTAVNAELSGADLIMFNLESPLQPNHAASGDMDLTADPSFLSVFPGKTTAAASIANNHALDNGLPGLHATIGSLEQQGIIPLEHGGSRQIIMQDASHWILAAYDATGEEPVDFRRFVESLAVCEELFCVVSIHWGTEYSVAPGESQRTLAVMLADAGVDVILGHHPHVLQPVEWIETAEGKTLAAYSMGNLLFDMTLPDARRTAVLRIEVSDGEVIGVCAVPYTIQPGTWEITPSEQETADAILSRLGVGGCPGIQ